MKSNFQTVIYKSWFFPHKMSCLFWSASCSCIEEILVWLEKENAKKLSIFLKKVNLQPFKKKEIHFPEKTLVCIVSFGTVCWSDEKVKSLQNILWNRSFIVKTKNTTSEIFLPQCVRYYPTHHTSSAIITYPRKSQLKSSWTWAKRGVRGPTERENYVPHKFSQDFHTVINDINNEIIKFIKKNQHD